MMVWVEVEMMHLSPLTLGFLALFRRVTKTRTSLLALRSRRFLVEISRIIDRFQTFIRAGHQCPCWPIVCMSSDIGRAFPCASFSLSQIPFDRDSCVSWDRYSIHRGDWCSRSCVARNQFDLSEAFDTVDHDVLVEILVRSFSLCSTAIDWLPAYTYLIGDNSLGEPRASWLVGQVGICAIKLQCVAGKQSKRKFMNEQAQPVLSFNSDLVVRRFVFRLSWKESFPISW